MPKKFHAAILITGISGMIAQIILLRELLLMYLGNELSLGIIIANWMLSEAAGACLISGLARKTEKRKGFFVFLQIGFSFFFILSIFGIRLFKNFFSITPGEMLSPEMIFLSSLCLVFLPAFLHGALFTLSCKLKENKEKPASSIGVVFIFETAGNVIAALLLTFILIPYFHSIAIAFFTASLIIFSTVFLIYSNVARLLRKRKGIVLFLLLALLSLSLAAGLPGTLHKYSMARQWKGYKVLSSINSVFGNVTATQREEQVTFSSNGHPALILPVPDIESQEELVHIPLLFVDDPQNALVVSGGLGGLLQELMKYPSLRVDYTELDPAIIQTAIDIDKKMNISLLHNELSNKRIQKHLIDGRIFLSRTEKTYDAIFINLHIPSDLQTNRLYTEELFSIAKSRLNANGILVLKMPGSLNYLSDECKSLNVSILSSILHVFPSLFIVPGETFIYIAGRSKVEKDPLQLASVLKKRKMPLQILTPFHLSLKLDPSHQNWLKNEIKNIDAQANKDYTPAAVYYAQSYLSSFFSENKKNIFLLLSSFDLYKAALVILLIPLGLLTITLVSPRSYTRASLVYTVFTTGLSSMFFNMTTMLIFQILYGYIYTWISFFIASFMAGISIGGVFATRRLYSGKNDRQRLLFLQILMSGLILLLLFFPLFARQISSFFSFFDFLKYILLFMNLSFGILQGLEFPLVSKMYNDFTGRTEKTAGILYSTDLFGGFAGGIISSVFLIPLYGFAAACGLAILLKLTCFVVVFLTRKEIK